MNRLKFLSSIKWVYFIFIIVSFTSCKKTEENIEKENIISFNENKLKLNKAVRYLASKYFTTDEVVHVVLSKKDYTNNNIYYDSNLSELLKNMNIWQIIVYRTNPCENPKLEWELFFEIIPESSRKYYYVYQFCDSGINKISESPNSKDIPIDNKWVMEIEKN